MVSFTNWYAACSEALSTLYTGSPVRGDAVLDWLEESRPDVVDALRRAGYGDAPGGGDRRWTWRQYLGNVLARMARQNLIENAGHEQVERHGKVTKVPLWRPKMARSAPPSTERRTLTVRLDEEAATRLLGIADARKSTLQSIVEQAVVQFVEREAPVPPASQQQLVLLRPDRKHTSPFVRESVRYVRPPMVVAGLFAGIGGLELGLSRAGHRARLLCEIDDGACAVLRHRFAHVPLHRDIRELESLPDDVQLLVGGFPCQDLSQAGKTKGIRGARSGLVGEVFRLLADRRVPWILLENVPFMLQLGRGEALEVVVSMFEHFGYKWAYRVVETRSTGLPQRRQRVLMLGSLHDDPRGILLADDAGELDPYDRRTWRERACGFYWTEGVRGLGWADDAVPTLKAGSTVGIPSPPAIVLPSGEIVKPDIRDAERMQGFEADWTAPSNEVAKPGHRWRLVGNAVTVDVAEWIGHRLRAPGQYDETGDHELRRVRAWPHAGYNVGGGRRVANVSAWPMRRRPRPLAEFLEYDPEPLSVKATEGFLRRAEKGTLRFPPGFIDVVRAHLERMKVISTAA